jgi:SAM-dependent MidA family methyltransferase
MASATELPVPDLNALRHSERVAAEVRKAIADADGWIPFERYMDLVLYAPGLGYYVAGACALGAGGDFTTAPELTPLYAAALAVQVDAILAATTQRELVELGAGSGRLAADLLAALAARTALPTRYRIVEVSPSLRAQQQAVLAGPAATLGVRVEWLHTLPAAIDGVVLANEVLDAIPVHVVARRDGRYFECGVGEDEFRGVLAWADRPAPAWLAEHAAARFPPTGDYRSELNPAGESLVEELARLVNSGAALFIDYGFPAAEYYHPQRSEGTLRCHYRHRVHDDPFHWPGLSDITAHVDFTAIAAAAERAGLVVAGFAAQAPFLMGCGILDVLAATGEPTSLPYIKAAAAVQKLLSPAEMGELFKVIALARSGPIRWPGFSLADHRHRL